MSFNYQNRSTQNQALPYLEPILLTGRPTGPFPYLIASQPIIRRHTISKPHPIVLNRTQKNILKAMKSGARLLFDVEAKRGLLYSFQRGIQQLAELSIRSLAMMVKEGLLYVSGREGRLIHYSLGSLS